MSRKLFLDLDGVLADFDANFERTFSIPNRSLADDAMWERINSHPTFWTDMPVMDGAKMFLGFVMLLDPIIITACPKSDYQNAAQRKREWVRKHISEDIMVLPVMGGRNKPLFMHQPGDVLVDDFERNTKAWEAAGGVAILHTGWVTTMIKINAEFSGVFW